MAVFMAGCREADTTGQYSPAVKQLTAVEVKSQLEALKGKVILVNFWATWCPPCRMEIPGFVSLQEKYGPQGLQIFGLSLDEQPPAHVARFASKNKMNYPIHIVGTDTVEAWGGIEAVPTTFLLDAQGKKVWRHEGYASPEEFENQITPLLKK